MKRKVSLSPLKAFSFLILLAISSDAMAASSQFYTMSDRWEKRQTVSKESSKEVVDEAFKNAIDQSLPSEPLTNIPRPSNLVLSLNQVEQRGNTIELELHQALILGTSAPVVKYVATTEGVVYIEREEPQTLTIVASSIGTTFVHVWDASTRRTFEVRVVPARYVPSQSQQRYFDELQKSRSFKVGYNMNRDDFYTGDKFREVGRSSLNTTQGFVANGDTPYGYLTSGLRMQKSEGARNVISDARLALLDGHVGQLDNFNMAVGDSAVTPDLIVFPTARVRGVDFEHWNDDKSLTTTHFYGREQASIIGTLTPSVLSKQSVDSFLSGNVADWKPNDKASVKAGYFTGSGKARSDELNLRGAGAKAEIGPYTSNELVYKPEVDYDNEHIAQKHEIKVKPFANTKSAVQFRDINKNFETLLGAPARQGELGYLWTVEAEPRESIFLSSSVDIFRDRLIPNPDDLDRYNKEIALNASIVPWNRASLGFNYQLLDDRGRFSPVWQESYGAGLSQGFDIWGHRSTIYTRYNHRDNEALTNPLGNYTNHQWVNGFVTVLFWDINFSIQHQWNWLHQPNAAAGFVDTEPRVLTYTFDRAGRIYETPLYYDLSLEIRDEEETEATNAFLTGEDSTRFDATLSYRENDDWEVYAQGTIAQYVRESNLNTGPRVEAQLITGVRYLHDTGRRWESSGNLEGYVFKDVNGDGLRAPEEPGIPNMKIAAYGGKTAVSDQNGFYEIKGVHGKKIQAALDSSNIPYGYVPTSSTKQEKSYTQGQTVQMDFGLAPRSEIAGIVYNDLNGNGRYDVTDLGIRRVRVTLEDGAAARTNGLGAYSFPKILAGAHTVSLDLSSLSQGYLPAFIKKNIVVSEGLRYQQDFPVCASRSVNGQVYWDDNGNETLDKDEKPASGITVQLGAQTSVTDAKGYYLFENAPAGNFNLTVSASDLPAGWIAADTAMISLTEQPAAITGKNIPLKKRLAPVPVAGSTLDETSTETDTATEPSL